MNRNVRAFTLLELLFIVAIISVLAGIAVPNFLEAQTRSKVARVRVDMSVISMGMERYYSDHGAYPNNHLEVSRYLDVAMQTPVMDVRTTSPKDALIPWYPTTDPLPFDMNGRNGPSAEIAYKYTPKPPLYYNARQLANLTSPVAYLESSIRTDPLASYQSLGFFYINNYELFTDDSITSYPGLWGGHLTKQTRYVLGSEGPDKDLNLWHPISGPWINYDPTNGTSSGGDIFLFEGKAPESQIPAEEFRPELSSEPDDPGESSPFLEY